MCLVGVVVRRYIDFLILLIPTPLVSALFCLLFVNFFKCLYYIKIGPDCLSLFMHPLYSITVSYNKGSILKKIGPACFILSLHVYGLFIHYKYGV